MTKIIKCPMLTIFVSWQKFIKIAYVSDKYSLRLQMTLTNTHWDCKCGDSSRFTSLLRVDINSEHQDTPRTKTATRLYSWDRCGTTCEKMKQRSGVCRLVIARREFRFENGFSNRPSVNLFSRDDEKWEYWNYGYFDLLHHTHFHSICLVNAAYHEGLGDTPGLDRQSACPSYFWICWMAPA